MRGQGRLRQIVLPVAATAGLSLAVAAAVGWLLHGREVIVLQAAGRTLELRELWALWLLCLLPWVWLGAVASLTDMSRKQLLLQAVVRTALLLTVTAGLLQPALRGLRQTISLVALVDASDSMTDGQLAAAAAALDELRDLAQRGGHELHQVVFAARPARLSLPPPGPDGSPGSTTAAALRAAVHRRDSSDLQAALQLAHGLHSPGTIRRVLLLSDGNQTEGDLLAEAQTARRRGIRIDHLPLLREQEPEVLVRSLRLLGGERGEAEVRVGAPFTLEAEVYASAPQRVRAVLYLDGAKNPGDSERELDLLPGRNLVRFRSEARTAGHVAYRLQLVAPPGGHLQDRFADNNQALLALAVKGRPHVLYIEGEPAAGQYLVRALQREDIDVDLRNPYGLPASARELSRYDLVLLSDVSSTLISQAQMAAIESYVRDLGGGFIMAGGENSFGSGGYQGTLLEKVLPVRFEQEKKRDQPSLALVLCIDRSGSMNGPKLELAKEAARATAELLAPDDLIGVIAFDSQATPLVRLQPARNRMRIASDISRLQAGGGTQILPPLQEAYQALSAVAARIKHVILLTDGQAEYQGILELVDRMVEQKITVSAVGVGAGADQTLLTAIAEHGGGRFYFTQDATSVPRIFTKETTQVARSALVEEAVRVVVQKRAELLDGTGIESAPPLRGYVATKAKPLSETILASSLGEPILVRWRYGLGQTAAFTSDVKNRWAVDWLRWPGYGKFFAQLVRSTMRQDGRSRGHGYDLVAQADPPRVHVQVDAVSSDDRFISGLGTTLEVLEPAAGTPTTALTSSAALVLRTPMLQTAPGRYEAEVRIARTGSFLLRAVHRADEGAGPVVAESWGQIALSYPREYLALPPDLALLQRVSAATGGRRLKRVGEALQAGQEQVVFFRDLWPHLCALAIALLLFDVALRRLRIFGYRPLSL
ncbi:MAG: VWA domain-containing protein [Myxococcales bacterium]|nr:VWA domain-containing protein [Myxococcota bacterium]MDW8280129.1 VWA domain-containing protein [Myxococcales bacterium]